MRHLKEIAIPFTETTTLECWQQKADRYYRLLNIGSKEQRFFVIVNLNEPCIEHCSPGVYGLLGFRPQHFTIPNIFRLIHPEDAVRYTLDEFRVARFIKQLPTDERSSYKFSKHLRIRQASGRYVLISQQMVVMNDVANNGNLQAFVDVSLAQEEVKDWKLRIAPIQYYCPKNRGPKITPQFTSGTDNPLTDREMEILRMLATNMSTKEIAEKIIRSPHTVKNHRKNMLRKSETSTTLELILLAKRKSWL